MATVLVVGRLMGDDVSSLLLVAYGICLAIGLLAVFGLPPMTERHALPAPGPTGAGLASLRRNRPLMLLLLIAFLISCGGAVMNIYLGLHLRELDGSSELVGPAFAIMRGQRAADRRLRRLVPAPPRRPPVDRPGDRGLRAPVRRVQRRALRPLVAARADAARPVAGIFLMASVTLAHRPARPTRRRLKDC